MKLCEFCGVRAARGERHAGCWWCYQDGVAAHVDPGQVAAHIAALRADGWAWTHLAEAVGCSRQTLWKINDGRVAAVRQWVADAVLAIPLATGCQVCEDVQVAALSTDDPHMIATRVGKSISAIEKHLYRHGRGDLARTFTRNHRERAMQ